jgi:hypothetical protein
MDGTAFEELLDFRFEDVVIVDHDVESTIDGAYPQYNYLIGLEFRQPQNRTL